MKDMLKKLFWVSRPISWPNTAFPFAAGYMVVAGLDNLGLVFFVGTLYFLWPYNLLLYGVNDVFDYESDILNPRKGGIEGMKEAKAFHPTIIKAALILNLPFVIFLLFNGNFLANVTLIVLLFFVLAYSLKGLRFKEIPFLDSITSSLHFVGPLIYALTLTSVSSSALPYVLAFFVWGMASHAFGAVQDIIPDRQAGLKSIATVLGSRRVVRLVVVLYLSASALVISQGGLAIIIGLVGLAYAFNAAVFWNITDKNSSQTNAAWRRFIWLNFITGFIITLVLIMTILK